MKTLTNLNKPPQKNPQAALQNLTEHICQNAKCLTKEKIGRTNAEIRNLERNKEKIIEKANSLDGANCQGASETGDMLCPSTHRAPTYLWNGHSKG